MPGLLLRVDPEWDKIIENVRFCAGGSRLMLGLELNLKHLSLRSRFVRVTPWLAASDLAAVGCDLGNMYVLI